MSSAGPAAAYWLTFAARGAVLSFAANPVADSGSHGGASAALGMWRLSLIVSGAVSVGGAVLAIFPRARDIGIALLAAGLGGLITVALFAMWFMAPAS